MIDILGSSDFGPSSWAARLADGIRGLLRGVGSLIGRAGFGVFIVIAAILALLATTVIGLALCIAVLCLSLAGFMQRPARIRRAPVSDVLETRRTADGWVIEPSRR